VLNTKALKGDSKKIQNLKIFNIDIKNAKSMLISHALKSKNAHRKKLYKPKPFAPNQKSIFISFSFISPYV
jgi:hypothetical protein